MRGLLVPILCIALCEAALSAADSAPPSEDTLRKLSAAGERYVDGEIKRALLGVRQAREMMERKEEKHRHLMDALRHSSDKEKGATQLVRETEQKLQEAQQQCQVTTRSSFEECRPCLEDTCKAFYTSTCRRGFAAFSFQVEEFFRKMAAQLEASDVYDPSEESGGRAGSAQAEAGEARADLELLRAEASFGQLLSSAGLLYNQSLALARGMQQAFGRSFLAAFPPGPQPSPPSGDQGGSTAGFLGAAGPDNVFDSVYDFGRNVLGEFSSTVAHVFEEIQEAEEFFQPSGRDIGTLPALGQSQGRYMCRRLRRQASECWQLQDLCDTCKDYLLTACPSVQQLHSEVEEMHMLLNASRQQRADRLALVQRHTANVQRWLGGVDGEYGWVGRLSNGTVGPGGVFNVMAVIPEQQVKNARPRPGSSVVVTILDSAPLTVLVPADLEVDDPAFIQYAAQEALTLHKRQIRGLE